MHRITRIYTVTYAAYLVCRASIHLRSTYDLHRIDSIERAVKNNPRKITVTSKMTSFVSSKPLANESKCVITHIYESTCAHVAFSYWLTQPSTHSIRQTPKVTAPAMIWFRVSVEINVPMAIRPPACNSSPRYPMASGFQSGLPYRNRNRTSSTVESSIREYMITAASHFPV